MYTYGVDYNRDEDYLMLSGLQHFAFCRRQWALIHLENQWEENLKTVEGNIFHKRAHEVQTEKRGELIITRGLKVVSHSMGVTGVCDVVEFHFSSEGISLNGWPGTWKPYPVEYKKGQPKEHDADELQLCAQAMCLEEMLLCFIPEGSLYYGEPRRRKRIEFTESLRLKVIELFEEMHQLYQRGHTPKARQTKGCKACSLRDVCIPKLNRDISVKEYLENSLKEDSE